MVSPMWVTAVNVQFQSCFIVIEDGHVGSGQRKFIKDGRGCLRCIDGLGLNVLLLLYVLVCDRYRCRAQSYL